MTSALDLPRAAVGRTLTRVTYELLGWEIPLKVPGPVDEVSVAATLSFNGTTVRFHWALRPPIERLAVGPWEPGDPTPDTTSVDVAERWSDLIGRSLLGWSVAFQDLESGLEPWACRLDFSSARHLVIALGEVSGDVIRYVPDSLILTTSRGLAEGYRPRSSRISAWGSP